LKRCQGGNIKVLKEKLMVSTQMISLIQVLNSNWFPGVGSRVVLDIGFWKREPACGIRPTAFGNGIQLVESELVDGGKGTGFRCSAHGFRPWNSARLIRITGWWMGLGIGYRVYAFSQTALEKVAPAG